jgi:3-methyladenine DNA glycosylase AlkD
MKLSSKAKNVYSQINSESARMGDLKKIAAGIKKDHELAIELWSTGEFMPRLLAMLIFDKKLLTQEFIDKLDVDMQQHSFEQRNQLMEWLMANQLMKDKNTVALVQSWQNSPSSLQRRTFWYYQARLRWMGQTPPDNTPDLLSAIEKNISTEVPEVQWAMNFAVAWIGVFDKAYRKRCIKIGVDTGLYKDEVVSRGCTPNYLPAFIEMEANKRGLG